MAECGTTNSVDCQQDYNNKESAKTVDLFCQKCWLDGSISTSFRSHCNLCCTKCEADGTAKVSESSGTTTGEHSEVTESTEASTTSTTSSSSSSTSSYTSSSAAADTTGAAAAEGMVVTQLTEEAVAGATTLTLADLTGIAPGELLTIASGGNTETKTITSVTSRRLAESSRRLASGHVVLDSPLQHAYPAGSAVEATPAPTVALNSSTTEGTGIKETSVVEDKGSSDGPLTLVWVLLGTLLVCCCIAAISFALMRKKSGSSTKKAKKSIKKAPPVAPASRELDALDKEETQPLMAVTATPTPSLPMYVQPQPSVQPIYMPTYAPQAGQPFEAPQSARMGAANQYAQFMPSAYPPASVV